MDSGTRVGTQCGHTSAILPAPDGDPRMFHLIDGALHVSATPDVDPMILTDNEPSLRVTRLVAIRNANSPLQILAATLAREAPAD